MIGKTAEQMWGVALAMSPGNLIDKFLDWLEELSGTLLPAHVEGLTRIKERRDPISA
jgi:hypothetical protein